MNCFPNCVQWAKQLLVISHDDRYFHLADRLIRMENGRLTQVNVQSSKTESETIASPLITAHGVA